MRYWDSSAVVPLLVRQEHTDDMLALLDLDSEMTTWWGTRIECYSAMMRLHREGSLETDGLRVAEARLRELQQCWDEVLPSEACRRTAERMLRVHVLSAADALQLAAAFIVSNHDPARVELVCFDTRLGDAAQREGFLQPGT